jgi:hypothetical protein
MWCWLLTEVMMVAGDVDILELDGTECDGGWDEAEEADDPADPPLECSLGTTVAVKVGPSSGKCGSCLSFAGDAQLVYLGEVSSNLFGLISTSNAECLLFGRWSSPEVPDVEEVADGGLMMSAAAASLPSLLDLESTLRRFNLRLWNKLMVMSGALSKCLE